MTKYYVTILTEDGDSMTLVTNAESEEVAEKNISKGYHFNSILHISKDPPIPKKERVMVKLTNSFTLALPYRRKSKIYDLF